MPKRYHIDPRDTLACRAEEDCLSALWGRLRPVEGDEFHEECRVIAQYVAASVQVLKSTQTQAYQAGMSQSRQCWFALEEPGERA